MNNIPTHLAFIADGNRRWARERGLPTLNGHKTGFDRIDGLADECFKSGVKYVSFYIFSTENWDRTKEEVSYLMRLAETKITSLAKKMAKKSVKLAVLGDRDDPRVPAKLRESINSAEELTRSGTKGTLAFCFNYGGRQEIAHALQGISESTNTPDSEITSELISQHLYHPEIPDADMIIRTSGEQRLSGFLLWRSAYAELLFLDKHFPDLTSADIPAILAEYTSRHRRFGK